MKKLKAHMKGHPCLKIDGGGGGSKLECQEKNLQHQTENLKNKNIRGENHPHIPIIATFSLLYLTYVIPV